MYSTPTPAGQPPMPALWRTSPVLLACTEAALAEASGLVMRWSAALNESLRQQETWTASPGDKADLSLAIKELNRHKPLFESRWPENWRAAIAQALGPQHQAGQPRRSLASISFDDLELMDEVQVQATVQVARLEQVVQGAAGDALSELTALLSSAQKLPSVKAENNPFRPDVAITALRVTMDGIAHEKTVRTLWLQHGNQALGEELKVLYRHLIRILEDGGVQRGDYNVIQAPAPQLTRSLGPRTRPPGVGDQHDELAAHKGKSSPSLGDGKSANADADMAMAGTDLLTLDGLHHLLVGDHDVSHAPSQPTLPDEPQPAPGNYQGPDRRAQRAPSVKSGGDSIFQMQTLAQGVVQLMLDGMTRDERLLQPVRQILARLQPALLRIAEDDPRFIADKLNPARRLLEEITQRSLAFGSELAPGFTEFVATLEDVVLLFSRSETRVSALFETALEVLQPPEQAAQSKAQDQVQGRAVASLVKVEQRFLLAEKIGAELASGPDFAKVAPAIQQFIVGPWAQVIAQAKMGGATGARPTRVPADLRYQSVLSDLMWSSRPEVAGRNRGRLARLIPGVLRTLREGLQTIDYDPAASRSFFAVLMARHELGLKGDGDKPAVAWPPELILPAVSIDIGVDDDAGLGGSSAADARPWLNPSESADTGFMAEPFPELHTTDFADTVPMGQSWDAPVSGAAALTAELANSGPKLAQGTWIELLNEGGQWGRMQLTWSSPHGTMYLFTGQAGVTTSMTRRNFDGLWAQQRIRVVASHSVVDDALGGVLDTAMRNSTRAPLMPLAGPDRAQDAQDTSYPDLLPPLS